MLILPHFSTTLKRGTTADGAIQLWEAGAISSVSVMAFGSDVDHAAKLLIENNIPTGVHLALNHGRGVLPADEAPSLHTPNGDFWNSAEETLARLVISEAKREFEAQIEKLLRIGIYELSGCADETLTNRATHYRSLLCSLKPGLNYIFSHPAPPTATIKAEFEDHAIRNHDFTLFMSSEWKEMIAEAKITLVSFPTR